MGKIVLSDEEQKELDDAERKSYIEERKRLLKIRGKNRASEEGTNIIEAGKKALKRLFG
jgi:hypothetical protein